MYVCIYIYTYRHICARARVCVYLFLSVSGFAILQKGGEGHAQGKERGVIESEKSRGMQIFGGDVSLTYMRNHVYRVGHRCFVVANKVPVAKRA